MKKRFYEIAVLSKGAFARTVRIYAPKHADRAIIMHDGQNVFRDEDAVYKKSWRAAEVLKSAGIKNTAIIGIDCAATRFDDYLPYNIELEEYGYATGGGKANVYADYITDIVIPYLDKRFGFEFYGMLGSSCGGVFTAYYATKKNPRIKAYGIFSPAMFLSGKAHAEMLETSEFDGEARYMLYCGGNEISGDNLAPEVIARIPQLYVDCTVSLVNALRAKGAKNIEMYFDNAAVHDEVSWRAPEKTFFEKFGRL